MTCSKVLYFTFYMISGKKKKDEKLASGLSRYHTKRRMFAAPILFFGMTPTFLNLTHHVFIESQCHTKRRMGVVAAPMLLLITTPILLLIAAPILLFVSVPILLFVAAPILLFVATPILLLVATPILLLV